MRPRRVDTNQREIVDALRAAGAFVHCLHEAGKGCPDLLVFFRGRTVLMEVKAPRGRTTKAQEEFHAAAASRSVTIPIVTTPEQALTAIGAQCEF